MASAVHSDKYCPFSASKCAALDAELFAVSGEDSAPINSGHIAIVTKYTAALTTNPTAEDLMLFISVQSNRPSK